MFRAVLFFVALGIGSLSHGAAPVLDNERVTVWDSVGPLPPMQHDFVAVSLSQKDTAVFGRKGDAAGKPGIRTVVIEIKDHPLAPIANNTGYPPAFPRRYAKKLLENDQVVAWDNVWHAGKPTPMHFHDKDALVVYEATGALQSTAADGKQAVFEYRFGEVRFSPRDHSHTESLVRGHGRAVITELK